MSVYSTERKAAVIAKMLPPHNQSINQIARQEGIPPKTLYHWRSSVGIAEPALSVRENSPREWSQEEQFAVLVETAPLSAHAVAEYCRRKGFYPEQLQQWKDRFMQPSPREEKSNIAYIDTFERQNVAKSFTFLGYDFKVRTLKNYKGELYRKCMPGASMKAMQKITKTIKEWRIHRSTAESLTDFSKRYNVVIKGWIEYYGKFWYRNFSYRLWSALQSRLLKWMQSKFRLSNRKAQRKLALVRKQYPKLFAHWYLLRATNE